MRVTWRIFSTWPDHFTGRARNTSVEVIRRQDCDAPFVVPGIENVSDGLKGPRRGLAGSQIIEEQNIGRQHRLEHAEFAALAFRVVASLDFLKQLTIVVEESVVPAQDNLPEGRHGNVRFAHAAGAHQEDACFGSCRIVASKRLRDEFGLFQAMVPRSKIRTMITVVKVGVETVEIAVLVSRGDARPR